jgi:MSHA biogenesis protein MshL
MTFPQPTPVRDVLALLVRGTPFSVVPDPDVGGTFAGELKEVTMRQALGAVLVPLGLDFAVDGQIIRVFQRRPATRFFDVNYLNVRRSWRRGIRGAVALSGQPAATDSSSSIGADVIEELSRGVQALLSGSGRMHVDRSAGLVQVTDFDDRLDRVAVYLETVQLRALRQVRIEARVLEITLKDADAYTLDWNAVATSAGATVNRAQTTAGVRIQDFAALLAAMREQGTVRVIAAPQVLAMNNQPAIMRIGTQEASFDLTAEPDAPPPATGLFAGLMLAVTPQIGADGIVQLSISPTYSEKTRETRVRNGGAVPVLTIAEADTLVRVQEGETVIVSGLLQDRARAKQSAGIAGFFGAQARENVKAELIILLTPTVVSPGVVSTAGAR